MSQIIAGHFLLQEEIEQAREALIAAGFPYERISAFYVNQPGQHDLYELGGDREKSPGAKETPQGMAAGVSAGGAVGAVVGAATMPLTGPAGPVVGALVGAHVGSLYSFKDMKEVGQAEGGKENSSGAESGDDNQQRPRKPGMLIAVALVGKAEQPRALDVLRRLGASQIEQAQGTISDGDWTDFDPLSVPLPVH
jgi:hypothetical protein